MKRIVELFLFIVTCLFGMTGCIKEIDPQSSRVTQRQAANAPGAFDNFVRGTTNTLAGTFIYNRSQERPWDYGYASFFLIRDVMGNDIALEDHGSEWYTTWYTCGTGLGPTYAVCQLPWTCYYGWVKNCNTVIGLAGERVSDNQQGGLGIAYAMRAMYYMDLARMFATKTYGKDTSAITVPLVLETSSLSELPSNPRVTNNVMWKHILADLEQAEKFLGNYQRPDVYTPDLSVVYGLKARAYLTMENWAKAEEYAKKAQEKYTLMNEEEYTSRTSGFNTPNSSWMFGLTFKSTDDNILVNDGDCSWGSQMILEVQASGCGYAANYGTPKRIDYHLYQTIPPTDFRKKCFLDFEIDELLKDTEAGPQKAFEALKAYSDVPDQILKTIQGLKSKSAGGLQVKFRPGGGEHTNQYKAFTVAVPLMRVEEMMLIEAEAAGMQDETRGIALLTKFAKSRDPHYKYGTHSSDKYDSDYATGFQNEVWWQRRVELWGEGFAMFDIKRLDKSVIRSYPNTNHPEGYRWNRDSYGSNEGNLYPNWMDFCIVNTEVNYNTACVNNPTPLRPTNDSSEYNW